jgi:hypothetical protein
VPASEVEVLGRATDPDGSDRMNYPTKPGSSVILDLPDEAYHALPELSSSQAKALLESPARFNYWRNKRRPEKKAYDVGHAVHAKVLGTGATVVAIPNDLLASNGAVSTKAAKEWVEQARLDGKVPMKEDELRPINDMAEAVLSHPTAAALLSQPGRPEVSVLSTDPNTGVPVRARFDYLPYPRQPRAIGVELKTTDDASPAAFVKSIIEYGYDLSQEWYRDTYLWATGEEIEHAFIVVEKRPPYLVAHYRLPEQFVAMGSRKAIEARAVFAECTASGVWPGYSPEIEPLEPPMWAVIQHEEKYAIEEMKV